MKVFLGLLLVAVLGAAGWYFFEARSGRDAASKSPFRTAPVERGEVIEGVAASGAVQPLVLVQVGTQVSGVLEKIYVDFNTKVTAGQPIARLDSRRIEAQIAQDEASVRSARANSERMQAQVAQAKAELERTKAGLAQATSEIDRVQALLTQAQKELERKKVLVEKELIAPSEYDGAVATEASLQAQLQSARASVRQSQAQVAVSDATLLGDNAQVAVAEAAVAQAVAQLRGDQVNLDYATIVSPVDGVVVSRNVDVGQTVAASLQAPTLFLIAQDLTQVQVQTSVPEADVGRIHEGQNVRFTVDAHPDMTFEGKVSQVRLASTTVSNVVTYTVIVDAKNPDGLLFPGMTANTTFEVRRSEAGSLKVPATALRVQPPAELVENPPAAEAGRPPRGEGRGTPRAPKASFVYVPVAGGRLRAVRVEPGISDGVYTVVVPAEGAVLEEGSEVVTAILREEEPATTNPFAPPRMPGGGRGMR